MLYNVSSFVINQNILIFYRYELKNFDFSKSWSNELNLNRLIKRTKKLFIWTIIVNCFFERNERLIRKKLFLIMNKIDMKNESKKKFNRIYIKILLQSINDEYDEKKTIIR